MSEQQMHEIALTAIRKILSKKSLTLKNAQQLNDLGAVATVYPRKKIVVVNGFQKYSLA